MNFKTNAKKFWEFLKQDTWQSWIVSIILIIALIKLVFFPSLSLITGSELPLVVVESCSMYHESSFDNWWNKNEPWYETRDISKSEFEAFSFKNGLNKGDIILVTGKKNYEKGDIIIFNAKKRHPLIHRIVTLSPLSTKGDHNRDHLPDGSEENINKNEIVGKATAKLPFIGWIKLIFFEHLRSPKERGLCK